MAKDDKKKKARRPAEAAGTDALAAALERLAALKAEAAALEALLRDAATAAAPAPAAEAAPKKKAPLPVSPLAPAEFPALPPVPGVRFAAGAAGVRYAGRTDVMLAVLAPGTQVAGVFTRSATRSAPILWNEGLRGAATPAGPQAILVNSGNANAFTGAEGMASVERLADAVAAATGADRRAVWMASTGVIGEPLPDDRIAAKLADLVAGLSEDRAAEAARAIMTTDTFPKGAAEIAPVGGVPVAVSGFAKGSGMIAPDMATMLGFVFTDASVERDVLQALLSEAAEASFNAVTVDGDTSTSDMVLLAATGRAAMDPIRTLDDPRTEALRAALGRVTGDLARQIARDGEGASKFVTVTVTGAASDASARVIAKSIANSPLVKTAIAGQDPNWGRIVMAVGKAGEPADRDRLRIRFGDLTVAENGRIAPGYREAEGAAYMKRAELEIGVDLGLGEGRSTVWTCDFTEGYVRINADYRS